MREGFSKILLLHFRNNQSSTLQCARVALEQNMTGFSVSSLATPASTYPSYDFHCQVGLGERVVLVNPLTDESKEVWLKSGVKTGR